MLALRAYSTRIGRLVALARIGFSAAALVVLLLDPSQPTNYSLLGYSILGAYVLWAAAFALYVHRQVWLKPLFEMAVYAVDVAVIAFVMVLTEGDTSPFFVFFTFILFAAMLRWSWRGVAWTAAAVFIAFTVITLLFDEHIDMLRVGIRSVYLLILASMLGYIAAHQERLRSELSRLSKPQVAPVDTTMPVAELLTYASGVFEAGRALLVWSDPEEPWVYVATQNAKEYKLERTSPDQLFQPLNAELAGSTFLCWRPAKNADCIVLQRDQSLVRWKGDPLDAQFRTTYRIDAFVTAPLPGQHLDGRIFVLDPPAINSDQLLMMQVIAEQIASRFELHNAIRGLQRTTANEERMRLARDLHDGVLQLLAGAGLQLQSMHRLVGGGNIALSQQINDLQVSIAAQQSLLRKFVDDLKPVGSEESQGRAELSKSLSVLVDMLKHQWQTDIDCRIEPSGVLLPAATLAHVRYLVAEATANARRHGGATRIKVSAIGQPDRLDLSIDDNGSGLSVQGEWGLEELESWNIGPVMLRERVRAMDGSITIVSNGEGMAVRISIPLEIQDWDNVQQAAAS